LLPIAFNAVPVHFASFWCLAANRLPRSFELLHCDKVWAHESAGSVRVPA
jgi:hypothetical protein